MEKQFVIFGLAGESYGVAIDLVQSIIKMQKITRLPQASAEIEGVIDLRGTMLPVMDLRRRLGLPAHSPDPFTRIIVLRLGNTDVGVIVDAVSEVMTVPEDAIQPPPSLTAQIDPALVIGIARQHDRLVILIDWALALNGQSAA